MYDGPDDGCPAAVLSRQLERENNQLRAELELAAKCVEALRDMNKSADYHWYATNAGHDWRDFVDYANTQLAAYDQFKSRKGGEAE